MKSFLTALSQSLLLLVGALCWLSLSASSAHAQTTTYTAQDYAAMGIDPPTILAVWTWGFGTVIFCWYLGYVAGVALTAIRKA